MSRPHRTDPLLRAVAAAVAGAAALLVAGCSAVVHSGQGARPPVLRSPLEPIGRQSPAAQPDSVCAGVTAAHEVLVSIAEQRLWACRHSHLAFTSPVTTGDVTAHEATPTGRWKVYAKQTDRWLAGPGYSVQVHYWMPFDGGYGFHDATWQKMPFGSPQYRTGGSHGCVHLPLATMARLFTWAPVGTTVAVHA